MSVSAIITAGGRGTRMGSNTPKQFLSGDKGTLLDQTLHIFDAIEDITQMLIVLPQDHMDFDVSLATTWAKVQGGQTRFASVSNGLEHVAQDAQKVLIHDGVRPFVEASAIQACIDACNEPYQGAILAMPVRDTLKKQNADGFISQTLSREGLWAAQTPQVFFAKALKEAFAAWPDDHAPPTDDAQVMEAVGARIALVQGSADNIKVTFPEDWKMS